MGAYLSSYPPRISQFAARALSRITGCTVLHSTESVFDEIGADTGAEGVARYISTRTTYGSYHCIADSDSHLTVVPFHLGAYQDGTGSNPWAMSLAFALRTVDWARMTPAKRTAVLRQGALAWAEMEAWKRAHDLPATALRRITKAQSDAGWSGFIAHGDRDPDRRTDPGTKAPHLFPWDEWFDACRWALAGAPEEDEVSAQDVWNHDVVPNKGDQPAGLVLSQVWSGTSPGFAALNARLAGMQAALLEALKANAEGTKVTAEELYAAANQGAEDAIGELIDSAEVTLTVSPPAP